MVGARTRSRYTIEYIDRPFIDYRSRCGATLRELDTCGLDCPLPLLKAKQALNTMASGEALRVRATDPGSQRDFRAFAEQSGHALLESSEQDGVFTYLLKKR